MKLRKSAYVTHRWLGLIVSLQLLAWSAGGFVFSILHIESVRGERDVGAPPYEPLGPDVIAALPASARTPVEQSVAAGVPVGAVTLVDRGLGPRWEVRDTDGVFVASETGRLTPDDAERVARRDFAHEPAGAVVELIETDPPIEYRAKPLPAYRVTLDHPKRPHLYVDARTGEITARRNRRWRVFDFFWMLHTMDYKERDDFNHPLLTGFSVLAMATSLSGLVLWTWRARTALARRVEAATA
jgi:uncharacterized iron-regulated membrane protein